MEATAEKLEAMFLKAKADLQYMEKRLKLDLLTSTEEDGRPAEENPAVMIENLRNIRTKHTALCSQVREVAVAQKESMDSIRTSLSRVMELLQHLQHGAHVRGELLTESLQESAELLGLALTGTTAEPYTILYYTYEELSEATLEVVPLSSRSSIKLAELIDFYQLLREVFRRDSSEQKMKQLKMKVSDAKLKVLQHL